MGKPSYAYVTYIRASAEKVFDAITDRELSAQYWGHANVSDWAAGSRWEHRRNDSSNVADLVGTVIESARPQRLVISWATPRDAADPDKVSRVTFAIDTHKDDVVRLTVIHDQLEAGSTMEQGITEGWPLVLASLKSWLETGKAMPL